MNAQKSEQTYTDQSLTQTRGRRKWLGSEVSCCFVSERLVAPLTDAHVRGCVLELARDTHGITVSVTHKLRSHDSSACRNERYHKSAHATLTGEPCAMRAAGRWSDGESDGAVHGDHQRIVGELRSPSQPSSQPCIALTCTLLVAACLLVVAELPGASRSCRQSRVRDG